MTGIWALLSADHAAAVWAAINTHAETTRQPGDERTADQRRADSLTDLATAYLDGTCPADMPAPAGTSPDTPKTQAQSHIWPTGPGSATGPYSATPGDPASTQTAMATDKSTGTDNSAGTDHAAGQPGASRSGSGRRGCVLPGGHQPPGVPSWCRVQVKVSADWLLGTSTEAPLLAGHGPVPAKVALRLLADADWQRIIYDPLTGALLDVGSTVHDPPAALREHVLVRDGGCTQPICSNPRVDLDHNTPFPHGSTSAGNLRSRCRHHHRLKQHPDWEARVGADGRIDWVTPTGHGYPEHEPDLRPGPSTRPRLDPDMGPDPPPEADDPPPF